jgi:hypothetical protein
MKVAKDQLIPLFGRIDAASVLEIGKLAAFESVEWTTDKTRPV